MKIKVLASLAGSLVENDGTGIIVTDGSTVPALVVSNFVAKDDELVTFSGLSSGRFTLGLGKFSCGVKLNRVSLSKPSLSANKFQAGAKLSSVTIYTSFIGANKLNAGATLHTVSLQSNIAASTFSMGAKLYSVSLSSKINKAYWRHQIGL